MNVTLVLILTIVVVSVFIFSKPLLNQKLMFNPYRVNRDKEFYRFLTSGFIHGGYMHLAFNVFTLYFFGYSVEGNMVSLFGLAGFGVYLALFLLGIVVSDIPTYLKYRDQPHYNSLGASGGVSAVVFCSIMFDPLNSIYLMFIPIPIPGFILGTLYIMYSYYQSKRGTDNINHDAHLWGALFGVAFSIVVQPSVVIHFAEELSNWSIF